MSNGTLLHKVAVLAGLALLGGCAGDSRSNSTLAAETGKAVSTTNAKLKVDTPTLSCGDSTQTSINVKVCAPCVGNAAGCTGTGLPAGFSVQWMTAADLAQFGWPANSDCLEGTCAPSFCKASFSGNANLSRYNLKAGECVTVNVGEFLFDNGASTKCPDALMCSTDYVFRAFGHATSTRQRSDFSANLPCSTLACGHGESCTFTQGYWKTHDGSPNENVWPVGELTLGTVTYTQAQLSAIFDEPAKGNGLISLAHQLIAAKLNIANGADGTAIEGTISAADALIGDLVVPPVGNGSLAPSVTDTLTTILRNYNEGAIGPGHCGDDGNAL